MRQNKHNSGAALVVAIAVLTVLLAIALTFFTVSRLEVKTSTNVENSVRADLLNDSAIAIAMSFLRHDALIHPTYTSLDHAWRTYFNGSWVQQKLYAWPDQYTSLNFTGWGGYQTGGLPQVFATAELNPNTGTRRPGGGLTGHLYVPRREVPPTATPTPEPIADPTTYSDTANPFVVPTLPYDHAKNKYVFSADVINGWADVDNDGDGKRDSVWIPLVADTNGGNVLDGEGQVVQAGDGIDNDLDGFFDEPIPGMTFEHADPDTIQGKEDNAREVAGNGEFNSLLYYGGNDGLDNDGDGIIDARAANGAPGDMRWFMTASLCQMRGAGITYVTIENALVGGAVATINTDPDLPWPNSDADLFDGQHRWVDVLDNDYDLVTNEHVEYLTPNDPTTLDVAEIRAMNKTAQKYNWPIRVVTLEEFLDLVGYTEIAGDYLGGNTRMWRIKALGEPACEIVGRAAILINDESSKVNLNAAGAHTLDLAKIKLLDDPGSYNFQIARDELYQYGATVDDAAQFGFTLPALFSGPSAMNYCTQLLPDTGNARSKYLWNLLTGVPQGWLQNDGDFLTLSEGAGNTDPFRGLYYTDALLPGYGMADDNANALLLSLNGIDDDGDGLVDEGVNDGTSLTDEQIDNAITFAQRSKWFNIPNNNIVFKYGYSRAQLAQAVYSLHIGLFEGVDEPGELQQHHPQRNLIAEGKQQGPTTGYDQYNNSGPANNVVNEFGELGDRILRTRQEVKNIALHSLPAEVPSTPEHLANRYFNLLKPYVTLHSVDSETRYGAPNDSANIYSGMQQPAQGVRLNLNFATAEEIAAALTSDWNMTPLRWPIDRTAPSDDREIAYFLYGLKRDDWEYQTCPLMGATLPADPQLHAAQLAVNIRDAADTDFVRSEIEVPVQFPVSASDDSSVQQYDPWWHLMTDDGSGNTGEKRAITYTQAGCEGIRITEMMVRPVRRVEAEISTADSRYNPNLTPRFRKTDATPIDSFDAGKWNTMEEAVTALITAQPTDFAQDPFANPDVYGPQYWLEPAFGSQWNPPNGNNLGDGMAYITTRRAVKVARLNGGGGNTVEDWPNIIEFRFGPSPELPPGRYYLVLNTRDANGNLTVFRPEQILYATKYVRDAAPIIPNPGQPNVISPIEILPGTNVYVDGNGRTIVEDVLEWCAANGSGNPLVDFDSRPLTIPTGGLPDSDIFFFRRLADSYLGRENPKISTSPLSGSVFMGTSEAQSPSAAMITRRWPFYDQNAAFTITIPEYAATPQEQVYLHVAIAAGLGCDATAIPELILTGNLDNDSDGIINDDASSAAGSIEIVNDIPAYSDGLDNDSDGVIDELPFPAINFFDFSQEPDHEWVEIENASGRDVDISNWKLTVGACDENGNPVSDDAVEMTIPENTILSGTAPNNRALLAAELTDYLKSSVPWDTTMIEPFGPQDDPADRPNFFFRNGIGMWSADIFAGTTVPPLPGRRNLSIVDDSLTPGPDGLGDDVYGPSVFEKNDPRIIQLAVEGLTDVAITSGDKVAKWVLRGGVLPNYPEHDSIDNDNDNAVLITDNIDNNGNAFVLQTNGDDDNGVNGNDDVFEGIDEAAEGIDEGRYFMDGGLFPAPGQFSIYPVPYAYAREDAGGSVQGDRFPYMSPIDPGSDYYSPKLYYGNAGQPLEWKTFMERRFYPGDNVVVSLMQVVGGDTQGVVDRVTYTEFDVINRVIRDNISVFDTDCDNYVTQTERDYGPRLRDWLGQAPSCDPAGDVLYTSFWPNNSMGIDFYRTLERRIHPFYNGDRFGTQNRWQPTDGNYDDWSHERVTLEGWEYELKRLGSMFVELNILGVNNWFLSDASFKYAGSPLERNAAAADLTAPDWVDLKKSVDNVQVASRPFVGPSDAVFVPSFAGKTEFSPRKEEFVSPDFADLELAQGDKVYSFPSDELYESLCVGKPLPDPDKDRTTDEKIARDRDALQAIASSNFTVLAPGQADVYSLYPTRNIIANDEDWIEAMTWNTAAVPMRMPEPWTPVFTYPLLPDSDRYEELNINQAALQPGERGLRYRYNVASQGGANSLVPLPYNTSLPQSQFLFPPLNIPSAFWAGPSDPDDLSALWTRWPVQKRTALFVSGNMTNFDPALIGHPIYEANAAPGLQYASYANVRAAEALFVWDSEDGLEDGEYNVYIDTGGTLTALKDQVTTDTTGTDVSVGEVLCQLSADTPPSEIALDIEMFTDIDNDGRCWASGDTNNRVAPTRTNLARVVNPDLKIKSESFGAIHGCNPDQRGLIHYGVVRVQNNYFALDLRNWSAPGKLCKFAGVILAPRDRNPGRLNINTVQSSVFAYEKEEKRAFNPLMGLPGLLPDPSPALNWKDYTCDVAVQIPNTATDVDFGVVFRRTGNSFYWYRITGNGSVATHSLYRVVNGDTVLLYQISVNSGNLLPDYGSANQITVSPRTETYAGKGITLFDIRFNGTRVNNILNVCNPNSDPTAIVEVANPTGAVGFWCGDGQLGFTGVHVQDTDSGRILLDESFPGSASESFILKGWSGSGWKPAAAAPYNYVSGTGFLFYTGEYVIGDDSLDAPLIAEDAAATPLTEDDTNTPLTADSRPPAPDDDSAEADVWRQYARYDRARRVEIARPSYWDGRYYKNKADLLSDEASFPDPNSSNRLYALSNITNPDDRERENAWRFGRLANQITTRSDVFEIIVTVQSGYGTDENGDGVINYRSNDEFVITAEKKTRTVYER